MKHNRNQREEQEAEDSKAEKLEEMIKHWLTSNTKAK